VVEMQKYFLSLGAGMPLLRHWLHYECHYYVIMTLFRHPQIELIKGRGKSINHRTGLTDIVWQRRRIILFSMLMSIPVVPDEKRKTLWHSRRRSNILGNASFCPNLIKFAQILLKFGQIGYRPSKQTCQSLINFATTNFLGDAAA